MEIECSLETINDEDLEEIYAEGVKRLREYFILGHFGTCQTMATKILHNFLKKPIGIWLSLIVNGGIQTTGYFSWCTRVVALGAANYTSTSNFIVMPTNGGGTDTHRY